MKRRTFIKSALLLLIPKFLLSTSVDTLANRGIKGARAGERIRNSFKGKNYSIEINGQVLEVEGIASDDFIYSCVSKRKQDNDN